MGHKSNNMGNIHHGKILAKWLAVQDFTIEEFCEKIGISRPGYYVWSRQAKFSDKTIETLVKKGKVPESLFKINGNSNDSESDSSKDELISQLKDEVAFLRKLVEQKLIIKSK